MQLADSDSFEEAIGATGSSRAGLGAGGPAGAGQPEGQQAKTQGDNVVGPRAAVSAAAPASPVPPEAQEEGALQEQWERLLHSVYC